MFNRYLDTSIRTNVKNSKKNKSKQIRLRSKIIRYLPTTTRSMAFLRLQFRHRKNSINSSNKIRKNPRIYLQSQRGSQVFMFRGI